MAPTTNELEEITAIEVQEFILRIAQAPNLSRADAIEGIVSQLIQLEQNKYFPYVFDRINPDSLDSETKTLDEEQRDLMNAAISAYTSRP